MFLILIILAICERFFPSILRPSVGVTKRWRDDGTTRRLIRPPYRWSVVCPVVVFSKRWRDQRFIHSLIWRWDTSSFGKITVSVQQKCGLFSKALHVNERRVSSYIQCTDKVVFPDSLPLIIVDCVVYNMKYSNESTFYVLYFCCILVCELHKIHSRHTSLCIFGGIFTSCTHL